MPPEPAAGPPVGVDVPLDPLTARHRMALLPEATGDPLGAPALGQPLLHHAPQLRRHLPGDRRGRGAPPLRLPLRLGVAVAPPPRVPAHPAPDRRPVTAQLAGDRRVGDPAFPRGVDLVSLGVGQVALALGHGGLPVSTPGLSPPSGRFATSCVAPAGIHPHRVLHLTVERGSVKRQTNACPLNFSLY